MVLCISVMFYTKTWASGQSIGFWESGAPGRADQQAISAGTDPRFPPSERQPARRS